MSKLIQASSSWRAMTWTIGQKLQNGKYTIQKELGRGRFGITYLAKDEPGNELVIKTLNEEKLNQLTPVNRESLKCQFVDEARKLECCQHPHVVKVYKTFIEGQLFCLAMEYIQGDTLASLAQNILPEKEALAYIGQIGEALIEVHNQGLLHRDVKPANIRVRGGQYEAVLIDFDLAGGFDHPLTSRWRDEPFAPLELNSQKISRGVCSDIYSLAATLYVLLTGRLPASSLDRQEGKADLIPPKAINPRISQRVNHAIMVGMRLEPEARPQTLQEWLNLLGLRGGLSIPWLSKQPRWAVILEIVGVVGVLAGLVSTQIDVKGVWEKYFPTPSEKVTPSNSKLPTAIENHTLIE